jgi:hypothetical protein
MKIAALGTAVLGAVAGTDVAGGVTLGVLVELGVAVDVVVAVLLAVAVGVTGGGGTTGTSRCAKPATAALIWANQYSWSMCSTVSPSEW